MLFDLPSASKTLLCVYLATALLNAFLPGIIVPGYALQLHSKKPMLYKLNGPLVLFLLAYLGYPLLSKYFLSFSTDFTTAAVTACALGLLASVCFAIRGLGMSADSLQMSYRAPTVDEAHVATVATLSFSADTTEYRNRNWLEHFYCGYSEFNPRISLIGGPQSTERVRAGTLDVKMWLYLVGALQLQLNVFAAVQYSWLQNDRAAISWGIGSIAFCLSFFIAEYMWNERVHLYTYDIFRERIGFKLVWGCLCFYPFFYTFPLLPLVWNPEADISPLSAAATILLYFIGWILTRGANLQKFNCKLAALEKAMKTEEDEKDLEEQLKKQTMWGITFLSMRTVPGSKGRLLCGGFWGLSRHINYLGEILQAAALGLPGYLATGSLLSFIYCAYYVALFIPRVQDDDAICSRKYGPVWERYKQLVPYAIIPGVW